MVLSHPVLPTLWTSAMLSAWEALTQGCSFLSKGFIPSLSVSLHNGSLLAVYVISTPYSGLSLSIIASAKSFLSMLNSIFGLSHVALITRHFTFVRHYPIAICLPHRPRVPRELGCRVLLTAAT